MSEGTPISTPTPQPLAPSGQSAPGPSALGPTVPGPRAPEQKPSAPPEQKTSALAALFQGAKSDLSRLTDEELPYTNEVDAALARKPSRGVRLLSLAVCLFFLCMLLWSAFATLDEVTHAEGQVVSSQRTQSIQNLEGGILQSVLVREGQIVEKDAPLARLDNEMAGSYYRDAIIKALDNQAAIIRLEAELTDTAPVFPDNLADGIKQLVDQRLAGDLENLSIRIISDHTATYNARYTQRAAELEVLVSQFNQRQRDVEEQLSRKTQLERSLVLAAEQRDIAYPLMQRRNYSRVEFLGLEQKVVALQGDIESIAASLPKSQAAAREAEQRIAFRKAELNSAVTEEINKRRMELNSLRETLAAGGDRVARTELRSPVRGTVKQIYLNTVGGVVKPGESIMEIVPLDDSLLIEARVRPADVAFLHSGQKAVVKVSAYDFSIYGGLEGHLEQISADTIEDKRGDFYYLVKVRTAKTSITYRQEQLPIIPGMITTVDIMTGKKTVLSYLLKPILKASQNALRER